MIELKNTTLLTANGLCDQEKANNLLKALLKSSECINFGKIKLLSCIKPDKDFDNITFEYISPLTYFGYSKFCIEELNKYVDTEFALLIQDDGFVINANLWNDSFFEYDYIGAPWKNIENVYHGVRVGNGGFSLRSKKLLEICQNDCHYIEGWNEDALICIAYRDVLLNKGIKFAPVDIAAKFSLELEIEEVPYDLNKSFGFHGKNKIYNNLKNEKLW